MAQVPLPPPPQTGQPIDSWMYLLWRRLTQAGQILWATIAEGTSADVAAAVSDETGAPGSLVFSGNPTLQGVTVDGIFYQGNATPIAGQTILSGVFSTDTAAGFVLSMRKSCNAINGPNFVFVKSRGTAASPTAAAADDAQGAVAFAGHDGTNYTQSVQIIGYIDGAVSSGVVPGRIVINTLNSSGAFVEAARINSSQVITLGGAFSTPALKVTPVASQTRWIEVTGATSSGNPTLGVSGGNLATSAVFMPVQATTAGAPAYVLGGMYFDTTLNKLRIGGATAWETVTSV